MGKEKQTTESSQQKTVQQTPEEREYNQLLLERERAAQPGRLGVQEAGLNLSNLLLRGQGLPGYLESLPGGLSPEAIGNQAQQVVQQQMPGFQAMGLLDSGVAPREIAKAVGSQVLLPAEQFNIQNLMQLLNQAIGGQAMVQAPIQAQGNQLSTALAGLRGTTTTGTSTMTSMNPFLKSFQTSAGSALGAGIGGGLVGGIPGFGAGGIFSGGK